MVDEVMTNCCYWLVPLMRRLEPRCLYMELVYGC